jgi:hypothetical protein
MIVRGREQVVNFNYMGTLLEKNGRDSKNMRKRIAHE